MKPSNTMRFISRIPWNDEDPDIDFVLDALISKGVDHKVGDKHVRIFSALDPNGVCWYHVDIATVGWPTLGQVFVREDVRNAISYFMIECDAADDHQKK